MEQTMAPFKILIADDLSENRKLISTFLKNQNYTFLEASNGPETIKYAVEESPDLILLDAIMPGMTGFEVSQWLRAHEQTEDIPILMITALSDIDSKLKSISAGIDDFVSKPVDMQELHLRVRTLLRIKMLTDELDYAEKMIISLALSVEDKDPNMQGHSRRIANYSSLVAGDFGLSDEDIRTVRKGAILHDIGKIAIQDNILMKPGPLLDYEMNVIKSHPEIGENICKPVRAFRSALPIIRNHLERYNGTGYPDHLIGEEIPMNTRIVSLADSYDTMLTRKSYRPAHPREEVVSILKSETRNGLWDEKIIECFMDVIHKKDIEELVLQPVRIDKAEIK